MYFDFEKIFSIFSKKKKKSLLFWDGLYLILPEGL